MWRLPVISFFVVLLCLFIWFSIYIWGFARPIYKFSPIELPKSKIFVTGNQAIEDKSVGRVIDVRFKEDVLLCNGQSCDFSKISSSLEVPTLILLNENKMDVHTKFFEYIKPIIDNKNIIFSSQYPVINKLIKEKQASWQFTTPDSEWLRLTLFKQIGLIHVPDMQADIWFSPLYQGKNLIIDQKVILEMKRRERQIIVRDIKNRQDYELAKSLGIDAVVIDLDLYLELH